MTSNILRTNIERSLEVHNQLIVECLPSLAAAADALFLLTVEAAKHCFLAMAAVRRTRSIWLLSSSGVTCARGIRCRR